MTTDSYFCERCGHHNSNILKKRRHSVTYRSMYMREKLILNTLKEHKQSIATGQLWKIVRRKSYGHTYRTFQRDLNALHKKFLLQKTAQDDMSKGNTTYWKFIGEE